MQAYDYIVVGAGSAGAAVANRLSADPRNKVLLLEAGRASHPWSPIPIGMARLITNPAANWLYSSEPEPSTNGRRLPVPRGKLLGGSSSINGMVFVRGQAQDFDTWAQLGNRGWSYTEVLPFFKRMESYAGEGDDAFRGREGPLRVTNPEPRDPLFATIINAAAQIGIRHNPDYNGASQEGIAMSQATIAGGRRMSTARCYLDPVRNRPNLHIETEALSEGLVLDGKRCAGVRYSVAGEVREAGAGRAVVISAGAFNSPQLLELSGIGQPERLRKLGIEVRHELPGVGENLRDHYVPRTRWLVGKKASPSTTGARPRYGSPGAALCAVPAGHAGDDRRPDPRVRALARGPGSAGPDAGLDPDADRTQPARPEDIAAVGSDPLCPRDAPGEQGTRSHRRGRSAPTAGDQFQFSVVAARRGADRARRPHRPRDHDRPRHDPPSGERNRAGGRSNHR
jgi:choline dehydrogenase-like flavoprotein